jgi:pimeloyl-ACP methyl ester carboxylesterase
VVLLHAWSCDRSFLAPQTEHFRRAHRVVAVDLRGHGQSDKPEQAYTMAALADDVAWLCRQLGVERPIVVGHSMGGNVAFELAARHPALPAAVVAVDSPIVPPAGVCAALSGLVGGLRSDGFRDAARGRGGAVPANR